ncbi:sugar ABC transporter permease [Paenibacillus hemerocallicola]|jgi:putative aldouronate transport system permease protein|uniref:Sugar ABC transporter permease n=1 Tax=Paenibacillus hemerocallicola TaxID=1172614 RepID=A0A5C4TEU7_9BACL|nr:ABC transporter permease subunit [Paenibacillus hemerocallicola]TNJ67067.1 sugar ABC transporter permease [Paenibacillus hemerocallicola]
MILPGAIIVFIYHYIPMGGLVMAFQKYIPAKGILGSEWVGLRNFTYVFSLPSTIEVFWNTLFIAMMKIVAGLIAPIGTALLLNEIGKAAFKRAVQTLIYLPHFLSWTILAGILIDILSPGQGIVNKALGWGGIDPIFFLGDNKWFPYTIVISNEWKEFGFSTIVYLAALSGVDPALYESAVIDGAGRWRQTWHITLPGIRPVIILLMTLSLGQILNAGFEQVFNLYSPYVYESGDIIDTMVYRMGLENAQYSLATAIGLLKSVVSLVMISVSYLLAYRLANYRIF